MKLFLITYENPTKLLFELETSVIAEDEHEAINLFQEAHPDWTLLGAKEMDCINLDNYERALFTGKATGSVTYIEKDGRRGVFGPSKGLVDVLLHAPSECDFVGRITRLTPSEAYEKYGKAKNFERFHFPDPKI